MALTGFNCSQFTEDITKLGRDLEWNRSKADYKSKDELLEVSQYPTPSNTTKLGGLTQFGIPVESPTAMSNVVKSLIEYSKVQEGLLDMTNFGGRGLGKTLVQIQPTNKERFKRNAKDWIKTIITTCADQSDMDKRRVILRLMKILAETDVSCLDEVATASAKALAKFKAKKLEPFAQMAMIEVQVELTYFQQRLIRKHLIQAGCNILLPEYVIKQYRAEFSQHSSSSTRSSKQRPPGASRSTNK